MDRRKTRNSKSVDETAQYLESLKMTRRSSPQSIVRGAIEKNLNGKFKFSEEFSVEVEKFLLEKLHQIIAQMVLVSKHRCSPDSDYHSQMAWLLHKEDLAVFFRERKTEKIPEFLPEYAIHAAEESAKNVLTAQSVRRLTLRDLLPFVTNPRILNSLCKRELLSEYTLE